MTYNDLKRLYTLQTRRIANACQDPATRAYILDCLGRLYAGDCGETPAEDCRANEAELAAGQGRIIARYKAAAGLDADIYIIAYFSTSTPGPDFNNLMIMFIDEY